MKKLYIVSIILFSFSNLGFSQCPQPGLKIQSASCDSARNLTIVSSTCSQVKVHWQGSQSQTYIVNAIGSNVTSNSTYQPTISKYSCDSKGDCEATIAMKEGTTVNWSVQSICNQNEASLYSYEAKGLPVVVPACGIITNNSNGNQTLFAFPNPTNRFLNIEYRKTTTTSTRLTIYNETGRQMLSVSGNALTRTGNSYRLDLSNLMSGTYFLKLTNATEVKEVKFVLIKN